MSRLSRYLGQGSEALIIPDDIYDDLLSVQTEVTSRLADVNDLAKTLSDEPLLNKLMELGRTLTRQNTILLALTEANQAEKKKDEPKEPLPQ